ncbi:unnamed protein product [Mytilus coruscus]|uniref:Endonuclease/exonuclease/phosphatase domain-containing protein n=1 Tax=Mytilus coruscus TaxID=42192 RepID=A0A6J8EKC1_MYTCO|nr:unnamed protein product [Mytilus coruscus]
MAKQDPRCKKLKPSKMLLFFLLLVIEKSNDIQTNPGPSNDSTKYLCGTCNQSVNWDHKGIVCETCDQWYHIYYQGIHSKSYEDLNDSMISWHCIICDKPKYSTVLFDLHSLDSPNPFASLYIGDINHSNHPSSPDYQNQNIKPLHASTPIRRKTRVSSNNKPVRVLNINFQSIKNKQHLVNNIIDSTKPDIIFGTETWLNPKIKDVEIFPDNFKLYRNDRKKTETDSERSGVLIAIKKELISSEVHELAPPDKTEMVRAKIDIVGSKILYLSSFYNPKTSNETRLKNFDLMIREATQIKNYTLIIGGDFNLPGWDWNNRSLKPNTNYPHLHYSLATHLTTHVSPKLLMSLHEKTIFLI